MITTALAERYRTRIAEYLGQTREAFAQVGVTTTPPTRADCEELALEFTIAPGANDNQMAYMRVTMMEQATREGDGDGLSFMAMLDTRSGILIAVVVPMAFTEARYLSPKQISCLDVRLADIFAYRPPALWVENYLKAMEHIQ
jgi:hypothetical protein